ncbi:MAG: hypothetical protein H8D22_10670, partial [Candidatus Cloacimonetes bacterium]|nr:hypothetical protein [Candidatus Cloacimonadota bacterium]
MAKTYAITEEIGVNLYKTLGLGDTVDKAIERKIISYELKFYIEDDSNQWIDFSDRIDDKGTNRLVSLASMQIRVEGKGDGNSFSTTMSKVTLDNHDGYFEDTMPTTLEEAGTGNSSSFDSTYGVSESIWYGKECKVAVRFVLGDLAHVEYTMGIFIIDNIETTYPFNTAEFTLVGVQMPLRRASASEVKAGRSWYKGMSISFLVRALLMHHYGAILDKNWIISEMLEFKTVNDGAERVLSHYGRPPSMKATNLETNIETINYHATDKHTRAIAVWEWGTHASYGGGQLTHGIGSNNTVELNLVEGVRPAAGDLLEIYGDANGNNGFYTISIVTELSSTTLELTLKQPLRGTDASSLNYHIHRVYMGIDNELWYWIPKRDLYVLVDNTLGSTYKIRKIWFSTRNGNLYGVAYPDPDIPNDVKVNMDVFKLTSGDIVTWKSDSIYGLAAYVIPGDITVLEGKSPHGFVYVGSSSGTRILTNKIGRSRYFNPYSGTNHWHTYTENIP